MGRRWGRARRTLVAVAGVALGATALVAFTSGSASAVGPGCSAGQIEVTNSSDTGGGSLRAAFTAASAVAGPQTICIDSGLGPITLTSGEVSYAQATPNLTVVGNGATISGNHSSRVINSTTSGTGGPLTLNGVTVTAGNVTGDGGGIFSGGNVTLINSSVSGNTASGGGGGISAAVGSGGAVTLLNSTVNGNTATNSNGGGIAASNGVTLTNSTVSGNTASAPGGGIFTAIGSGGNVTVINSTVSGNTVTSAGNDGGGILVLNGKTVTLVYATVVQNSASTGANVANIGTGASLTSFGSVVALPQGGGANCERLSTTSNGFNFSDDASCGFTNTAQGDRQNAGDPHLGALANNGGPTQTRLPLAGSPLIDAIPLASCQADGASGITTDQRILARPSGPGCDIGAVEVQLAAPAPVVITPKFTG